jgi:hypothetical protein
VASRSNGWPAGMTAAVGRIPLQVDPSTGALADTAVEYDDDAGIYRVVWLLDEGKRRVPAGLESRDPRIATRAARELRPAPWRPWRAGDGAGE